MIDRDIPVNLLDQYVDLNFRVGHDLNDQYKIIDKIYENRKMCIVGSGGSGKSIFTKYLWISFFVESKGKIPIFTELRNYNDITVDDFETFLFHAVSLSNEKNSREIFNSLLKDGKFIFVLDGFDEISISKKDSVSKQIRSMSEKYNECIFIVSGRPDENFDSWQNWIVARVEPLAKKQALELISKIAFDKVIKKKFSENLDKSLYDSHKSFLSNPLLVSIMLLTFDQFADIPEKMHIFYDQAFDTLYQKHDRIKDGFKRKKHAELPIDVFKTVFSNFCLTSYIDEKFEFSYVELIDYSHRAKKMALINFDSELFVKDLIESVCVIQADGLNYKFTHRSFQEYFSAYCISRMPEKFINKIASKIVIRHGDEVFGMVFDINQALFETCFLIPQLKSIPEIKFSRNQEENVFLIMKEFDFIVHVNIMSNKAVSTSHSASNSFRIMELCAKFYPEIFKSMKNIAEYKKLDAKSTFPHELIKKFTKSTSSFREIRINFDKSTLEKRGNVMILDHTLLRTWFSSTGHAKYILDTYKCTLQAAKQIPVKRNENDREIEDILGLN